MVQAAAARAPEAELLGGGDGEPLTRHTQTRARMIGSHTFDFLFKREGGRRCANAKVFFLDACA